MFQNVTGKLGNMRKVVEWTIYPQSDDKNLHLRLIQSDKRIAQVNLETKKAVLSDGKGGHQGFWKLRDGTASVVDVPEEMIVQIKSYQPQIGPVNLFGQNTPDNTDNTPDSDQSPPVPLWN